MSDPNWERLAKTVEAIPFDAGVSVLTLDGQSWGNRAGEQFSAASVIKIPIMVEIFHQIDAGERTLDDLHPVTKADKAPGSGVLVDLHDGIEVTLHDLLYLMISISDNTATNMLIDFAGMENVNNRLRGWGMTGTILGRKMQGRPAEAGQQENYIVPAECSQLIRMILNNETASPQSCEAMVNLLKSQANRLRLARPLGDDDSIEFGSKTGTIKGICNDAGFFRKGNQAVILSVLLTNVPDTPTGESTIGAIADAALADAGIIPKRS
jgi:beta-lactamase class A